MRGDSKAYSSGTSCARKSIWDGLSPDRRGEALRIRRQGRNVPRRGAYRNLRHLLALNSSNRRVRSRTHGGVGGEGGQPLPLSRSPAGKNNGTYWGTLSPGLRPRASYAGSTNSAAPLGPATQLALAGLDSSSSGRGLSRHKFCRQADEVILASRGIPQVQPFDQHHALAQQRAMREWFF